MLKKKLVLPLLALLLAFSLLPVKALQLPPELLGMLGGGEEEPAEFVLVSDQLTIYQGILGKQMTYVAELENKSDRVGSLNEATLQVLDAAGAELGTVPMYLSVPMYVQPGEKAFITVDYSPLTAEQLEQVASWQLTIQAVVDESPVAFPALEVGTEVQEEVVVTDYFTGAEGKQLVLIHTITNNTDAPVYDARTFTVLRDASGKAVAFDDQFAMFVGIPAGSNILMKGTVDAGLVAALEAAGMAPETVETISYYEREN